LACHFPGHSDSEPLEGPPEKLRNFLNKFKQIKEQWQLCCFVGFPATFSTKPQSFFEYFPYQVLLFFSGLVSPRQTPKTDFALQPKAAESWSPRFVFLANVCCRSRHAPFSTIHPTSPPTRSALPGRTCSTAPFPPLAPLLAKNSHTQLPQVFRRNIRAAPAAIRVHLAKHLK